MADTQETDIAIIGMAGRFPGAADLAAFWSNLRAGVESIVDLSPDELAAAGVPQALIDDPAYVRRAPILDGIDQFDAGFWGLTPREAAILDPQQRLFLECAWEALESAGYAPLHCGRVGVFAGVGANTYLLNNLLPNQPLLESVGEYAVMLANDKDYMPTRVSFKLNLGGPSVAVQTACSTSLVAVHLAVQSLLAGESAMALAGGAAVRVPQAQGYRYAEGMVHSPDGRCRPFDAAAQGTVGGSGAGAVLLKRLDDALADNDTVLAVIKGSAVNNDGADKAGFTAPSVKGQAQAIAEALAVAGVSADSVSYVEAHGTATALGDPIEITALTRAFRKTSAAGGYCAIGALKGNLGHLDNAAGVAGLIKAVLCLRHRELPPSLHFNAPNPAIDFADSPFYVNNQLQPWQPRGGVRRAGVSSFGIGGTNAHVVLEEAPAAQPGTPAGPWHLLPLAARGEAALDNAAARLAAHLAAHPEQGLADVAYTLQVGREAFERRQVVLCHSRDAAIAALSGQAPEQVTRSSARRESPKIAFLCTGQGSQHPGMGRDLYQHAPVFRAAIDGCAAIAAPLLGRDLRDLMFGAESLTDTALAQPTLFCLEYATARQWMAWGVKPDALIGHSVGEYAAACLAGVFSLEDALALVVERGRLMARLPGGSMLSVAAAPAAIEPMLPPGVELAAVNGPALCVVAGPGAAIAGCQAALEIRGIACRPLHTSHAFHSAMIEPMLAPFVARVRQVALHPPQIPVVSNLTGAWLSAEQATDPQYWAEHARACVRFADGMTTLLQDGDWALIELGPGNALATFARAAQPGPQSAGAPLILASHPGPADSRTPEREAQPPATHQETHSDQLHPCPGLAVALGSLGRLWLRGAAVDWSALHDAPRQRVPLPTYAFERSRHWIDAPAANRLGGAPAIAAPAGRLPLDQWLLHQSWQAAPLEAQRGPDRPAGDSDGRWHVWSAGGQISGLPDERRGLLVAGLRARGFEATLLGPADLDPANLPAWSRQSGARDRFVVLPDLQASNAWEAGAGDLLALAAAIDRHPAATPTISVVAHQSLALGPGEDLSPIDAALRGVLTVIGQERGLLTRWIDADPTHPAWAEAVIADLAGGSEPVVALRGHARFRPAYAAVAAPATTPRASDPRRDVAPAFRERGVYLITGGTGAIGLALAEGLARAYHARVALLSRSAGSDPTIVRHIADAGGEALLLTADVAHAGQLAAAIERVEARWGAINGVIHAAGIAGPAAFLPGAATTRAAWETILRPKLAGTQTLATALGRRALDWVAAMSSLSSVLGGLGFAAYASANLAQDALVHQINQRSRTPWIGINWDGWGFGGGPLGVGADDLSLNAAEGLAILERALAQRGLGQAIVSTGDLASRLRRWIERPQTATPEQSPDAAQADRPALDTPYLAPRDPDETAIAAIWAELLGIGNVGVLDNFFELGGHSLLATQVVVRMRAAFDVEVSLGTLFDIPTIAACAEHIAAARLARQVQERVLVVGDDREEIEL